MRHRKQRYQLNRFTSWRRATLRSLARNLLIYQSIKTSLIKAKAVKPIIDRLITLTKENSLASRRQAYKILNDHKLVSLLFSDIGERFNHKASGFTRIIKLGLRRGDNAQMAILELTEIKKRKKAIPKKEKEEKVTPKEPTSKEKPIEEKRPPLVEKPTKGFLRGIKSIFKKERDSLRGKRD